VALEVTARSAQEIIPASVSKVVAPRARLSMDVRPVEKSCSMAPFWTENPPMMEVVARPPLVFIAMMGEFPVVVVAIVQA